MMILMNEEDSNFNTVSLETKKIESSEFSKNEANADLSGCFPEKAGSKSKLPSMETKLMPRVMQGHINIEQQHAQEFLIL